jgi:hypothetical protein
MNKSPPPKSGDYLASAGGGGILVYCTQHFILDPTLNQAALYACPAVSMFFVRFYQSLSVLVLDQWKYLYGEFIRKRLLKQSDTDVAALRKQVEIIEKDGNSTSQHREEVRRELEAAEKTNIQLRLKGVVELVVSPQSANGSKNVNPRSPDLSAGAVGGVIAGVLHDDHNEENNDNTNDIPPLEGDSIEGSVASEGPVPPCAPRSEHNILDPETGTGEEFVRSPHQASDKGQAPKSPKAPRIPKNGKAKPPNVQPRTP